MFLKKLSFIGNLLLFSLFAHAQDPISAGGDTYFFLGISAPIIKVRDLGHSLQTYRGVATTLRAGYERIGREQVARVTGAVTFGSLSPKAKPKTDRQLSRGEITQIHFSYAFYQRTGANYLPQDWNRYIGGAFTVLVDMRDYNLPSNNLMGFQMNTSLNIGGFVQRALDNRWRFNYEAQTPILSYAVRPNYIGMFPISVGTLNGRNAALQVLKSGKVVTVNKLFRFYNRFGFDQTVKDHRQRRFSYAWEMLHNRVSQPMTSVIGGLGYESLFKM
jgi:hypothetical protein